MVSSMQSIMPICVRYLVNGDCRSMSSVQYSGNVHGTMIG